MTLRTRPLAAGRPAPPEPSTVSHERVGAALVAAKVRARVQTGALAPGEWLRESRLCADYGVGRSIVRDALKLLVEDGLVKFERYRGAYVASISLYEMFDLFEARAALYGLMARFACFRASDDVIARAVEKIGELIEICDPPAPPEQRIALGGQIFNMMAKTASPDAQAMIASINRKARWQYSYIGLAESPGGVGPVDHWRALGEALRVRDAEAAADAARKTIYWMQNEVTRVMIARGLGSSAAGPA